MRTAPPAQHHRSGRPGAGSRHRRAGLRRWLALAALLGSAPLLLAGTAPPVSAGSVLGMTNDGVCAFGPAVAPTPLTLTLTPTSFLVTGQGGCAGTDTTETATLALGGAGSFGCDAGSGGGGGYVLFDPQPPASQFGLFVAAVSTLGSIHLVISGDAMLATADLSWSSTQQLGVCLSGHGFSTPLAGSMIFATG